ncbi:hypothetical protein [Streptomyces sp. NPDC017520]|uniref:hypothetical protein n=1 Tax=Streptomyces sp. NPDC017520 TaxID=3364998 RepID=UPI0037B549B7
MAAIAAALGHFLLRPTDAPSVSASPRSPSAVPSSEPAPLPPPLPWYDELRTEAIDRGCPRRYADPTEDPRMRQ